MFFAAGGLVGVIAIGFWLFSLFDVITAPADQVRNLQKVLWVIIVLFGFEPGAIFWFFLGRPRTRVPAATAAPRWSGSRGGGSRRVIAPDDDIDFLRSLDKPGPDGSAAR